MPVKITFVSGRKLPSLLIPIGILMMTQLISVPGASTGNTETDSLNNVSAQDRLHMEFFTNYDSDAQPLYQDKPTNVSLSLAVNYLDIDEMDGKITLHCWLSTQWQDQDRHWDPKNYDNIGMISIPSNKVWKPKISLFNAAEEDGDYLGETRVIFYANGTALWVPPAIYTAFCKLNMRNWPYDVQICKLKIGSWAQGHIDASYNAQHQAVDFAELAQSTEWELVDGKTEYVEQDFYNYIEFMFMAKRRSTMYTAVIYTPASCIIILALASFWLPPQMGEKILLNGGLIVLISAFLMYFAQLLPVLAENTPMIVLFYSASLMLLSVSTIIEVIVLYLSTAQHKRRVPGFIKNVLNGKLGTFLLLSNFTTDHEQNLVQENGRSKELEENVYDNDDEISSQDINPPEMPTARAVQFDWVLLATAVDRISFLGFSVIYIVLAIVYSV